MDQSRPRQGWRGDQSVGFVPEEHEFLLIGLEDVLGGRIGSPWGLVWPILQGLPAAGFAA
jgi:hypothetical protein